VPELTIDGRRVRVPDGATLLAAAAAAGVRVPALCHLEGHPHHTSCMVCLVEDLASGALLPACAAAAAEGQEVSTASARAGAARRASLELLLSEHAGDCEAPCTRACPAHADVPSAVRRLLENDSAGALAAMQEALALPRTLAHVCPAPCERACRRGRLDSAVRICFLLRAAAGPAMVPSGRRRPRHDRGRSGPRAGRGPTSAGRAPKPTAPGRTGASLARCLPRLRPRAGAWRVVGPAPRAWRPLSTWPAPDTAARSWTSSPSREAGCGWRGPGLGAGGGRGVAGGHRGSVPARGGGPLPGRAGRPARAPRRRGADRRLLRAPGRAAAPGHPLRPGHGRRGRAGRACGGFRRRAAHRPSRRAVRRVRRRQRHPPAPLAPGRPGCGRRPAAGRLGRPVPGRSAGGRAERAFDSRLGTPPVEALAAAAQRALARPGQAPAEARRCLQCDCARKISCRLRSSPTAWARTAAATRVSARPGGAPGRGQRRPVLRAGQVHPLRPSACAIAERRPGTARPGLQRPWV